MIEIKINIPSDFVPSGNLLTETARYLAAINGMKMVDDSVPEPVPSPEAFNVTFPNGSVIGGPTNGEVGSEPAKRTRKKKEEIVAEPGLTKDIFMSKITAAIQEKKITHADVSAACIANGVTNLPEACSKPEVYAKIHEILGVK